MSIASDLLPLWRGLWAERLVDTCTIVSRTTGAFNTTTGTYDAPGSSTVYTGPCLVRPQSAGSVLVGEELVETRGYLVVVPFDENDVGPDNLVTVTSTFDGVLNGKQLIVRNVRADTYNTARKLDCEDNQGG